MPATTPARRLEPRRPSDVDSLHPGLPRPGRWAQDAPGLAGATETLRDVRAELAQLRAQLEPRSRS